ncbi:DNA-3-methyladenine glycosylase II [Tumebacillus sp. BK434]|nr:DNA-3-methyladenine glycosylase II [Tumebacillus sp. BK434]
MSFAVSGAGQGAAELEDLASLVEVAGVAGDVCVVTIDTPETFRFQEALVYLARSANECMFQVAEGRVRKLLQVDGMPVLFEVGAGDGQTLHLRFMNGKPNAAQQKAAVTYVREWLDLDRDLAPFYALAGEDAVLQGLVERYDGLRVVRIPELFEALCWAVIGQQINLTFAYTLKRRFVESFGEAVLGHWLFPRPERIAALSADELRVLQFTGNKAEYLLEIARQLSAGKLCKSALLTLPPDEAEKQLVSIRGIGPWTAQYVRLRCLGDASAFPIADVGLHNAIKARLGMERKPSLAELRELARPWKNWEGYATFYLWRSLT